MPNNLLAVPVLLTITGLILILMKTFQASLVLRCLFPMVSQQIYGRWHDNDESASQTESNMCVL